MLTRTVDWMRLRASIPRILLVVSVILPIVLAACGQDDNGGGGPSY